MCLHLPGSCPCLCLLDFCMGTTDSKMSSGNAKIGHPAPNFKATAVMPDGQFKDISLSDYKGE